jgi:hypothetical protein
MVPDFLPVQGELERVSGATQRNSNNNAKSPAHFMRMMRKPKPQYFHHGNISCA